MARVWNSIEEKAKAYEDVIKCCEENGITLDEAFSRQGFAPEDRLSKKDLLIFMVQKEMAGEFLPM